MAWRINKYRSLPKNLHTLAINIMICKKNRIVYIYVYTYTVYIYIQQQLQLLQLVAHSPRLQEEAHHCHGTLGCPWPPKKKSADDIRPSSAAWAWLVVESGFQKGKPQRTWKGWEDPRASAFGQFSRGDLLLHPGGGYGSKLGVHRSKMCLKIGHATFSWFVTIFILFSIKIAINWLFISFNWSTWGCIPLSKWVTPSAIYIYMEL